MLDKLTSAADLVVDLIIGLIAALGELRPDLANNEFRLSNSFSARGQSGTFERLSQNAVFASSADWKPPCFQNGSGGGVEAVDRLSSGELLCFRSFAFADGAGMEAEDRAIRKIR